MSGVPSLPAILKLDLHEVLDVPFEAREDQYGYGWRQRIGSTVTERSFEESSSTNHAGKIFVDARSGEAVFWNNNRSGTRREESFKISGTAVRRC